MQVLEDVVGGVHVEAQLSVAGIRQNALLLVEGGSKTVGDVLCRSRHGRRGVRGDTRAIELLPVVHRTVFIGVP